MASWSKLSWKVEPEPFSVPDGTETLGAVVPLPADVVEDADDVGFELLQPAAARLAAASSPRPASKWARRGDFRSCIRFLQWGVGVRLNTGGTRCSERLRNMASLNRAPGIRRAS